MTTMIRIKPKIPEGPYPHSRLWGHDGMEPSNNKIRMTRMIVPKGMMLTSPARRSD